MTYEISYEAITGKGNKVQATFITEEYPKWERKFFTRIKVKEVGAKRCKMLDTADGRSDIAKSTIIIKEATTGRRFETIESEAEAADINVARRF